MSSLSIGTNSIPNTGNGTHDNGPANPSNLGQRVHDFVMSHSLLWIGLGIAGTVVSCVVAFFVAEIALMGIIPSALLIILGSVNVSTSSNSTEETPRTENQMPVLGIPNRPGNNCWASCVMQLVLNTPSLENAILTLPQFQTPGLRGFSDFIRAYRQAQANGDRQLNTVSIQRVREACHFVNPRDFPLSTSQGNNAWAALECILDQLPASDQEGQGHPLVRVKHRIDGQIATSYREWVSDYVIQQVGFERALAQSPQSISAFGYQYTTVPEELLLSVERAVIGGNNEQNIPALEVFDLPREMVVSGETGRYECDTILRNTGGHFVSYVKKDGVWWFFDDAHVARASDVQVREAFQKGLDYHYKRIG